MFNTRLDEMRDDVEAVSYACDQSRATKADLARECEGIRPVVLVLQACIVELELLAQATHIFLAVLAIALCNQE